MNRSTVRSRRDRSPVVVPHVEIGLGAIVAVADVVHGHAAALDFRVGSTATSGCQSRSFEGRSASHHPSTRANPPSVTSVACLRRFTTIHAASSASRYISAKGARSQGTRTSKYSAAAAHSVAARAQRPTPRNRAGARESAADRADSRAVRSEAIRFCGCCSSR